MDLNPKLWREHTFGNRGLKPNSDDCTYSHCLTARVGYIILLRSVSFAQYRNFILESVEPHLY